MKNISVVISAFNAESLLPACLESVRLLKESVLEIIVIDNSSTDKTAEIAKKHKSTIYTLPNNPMLNVNKNVGFTKAKGEWILNLDADERVTEELAAEIQKLEDSSVAGYWIPRKNILFGKWMQSEMYWPDNQMRLFKKGSGKFEEVHVHEYIQVTGETEKLQSPMLHLNYTSVKQYIEKLNNIYTENEVENILKTKKEITWVDAIRYPLEDFLKTFFARKGYKDGLHGLVVSILQAFYAEVVFAKIWEKQGFKEYNSRDFVKQIRHEVIQATNKLHYWIITAMMDNSKNPFKNTIYRTLRKYIVLKVK